MRGPERGFLLLSSCLGDPARKPLTTAQLRVLADRAWMLENADPDRELEEKDLIALGYGPEAAGRILHLLSQEEELDYYLHRGKQAGCVPLTRAGEQYPLVLRRRIGQDCPGVLWAKGDLDILNMPKIALVGSRELSPENQKFAQEAGRQATLQGYALVSGNARGADRTAQESCLRNGGSVICVVADSLVQHSIRERVLYLSEEDFDAEFSAQRALSRNRCIHALGEKALVCQSSLGKGGTWDGTVKNLRFGWSDVFCFHDGSEAMLRLEQMGAQLVEMEDLYDLSALQGLAKIEEMM